MKWKKKDRTEEILKKIVKLEPMEFIGICVVAGVDIYEEEDVEGGRPIEESEREIEEKTRNPKDFVKLWEELCDKIAAMSETQKKNLSKLVRAATK